MFNYTIPEECTRVKLDVGLSYSAPMSEVWLRNNPDDLVVFGFEPNPSCVESISLGNIQKQHHSHGEPLSDHFVKQHRFHLIPVALDNVDAPTKKSFYWNNDVGTSSLFKAHSHSLHKEVTVDVTSLKLFLKDFPWERFPYIEYLKIDAQGSDLNILKGAGDYLNKIVFITAEGDGNQYQGAEGSNEGSITDYLTNLGFEPFNGNTSDPTFVNPAYKDIIDNIFIYQRG